MAGGGSSLVVGQGLRIVEASLDVEHWPGVLRLSSCGEWTWLSCSLWNLPGPGIEPMSPVLAGRFLTTGPPRKSPLVVLRLSSFFFFNRPERKTLFLSIIYVVAQLSRIHLQCRRNKRHRFHPWVRKIPWRRKWQPILGFLPGKSHGQKSLAGCSPWSHQESHTAEHTGHM